MPSKAKYINREISWLSFNHRVLQEAADKTVPLIERLKFLGIYSANLDEFFRVRVGTLYRVIRAGIKGKAVFGGSPQKILNEIQKLVVKQRKRFDKVFSELQRELEHEKIYIVNETELTAKQAAFVHQYFEDEVRPRLVPIMLDSLPEFPYLKNQVIYLAIYLQKSGTEKKSYALIEVPADVLPRFIVLPRIGDKNYVIMLDDVIRFGLKEIFSIFDFDTYGAYTIKLTRDAEFDIDDDITKSTFEKIAKSVKKRHFGQPVRFVYDRDIPEDLLHFILKKNKLTNFENLISGGRYHNAKDFINFPNIGGRHLKYQMPHSLPHKDLESEKSILQAIAQKDILLLYPYQSFHHVIDLIREAAIDPKVTSIKMTLYRVAKNSNVVNALINAIRNGKKVSVFMELQARFDEEANIYWTQKLEEEGAHLINGVPGLKVHAKLCLITRKEDKKRVKYAVIGTGNFNETTARIYSDHALLTAEKKIASEVDHVFTFLENNYKTFTFKHLIVSPFYMRNKLNALIRNEIRNARAGKEASIHLKLNSLVDKKMIDKLYQASQAGVKIKMIVRGICSLVPGVEGLSENITAISIVDMYLEHSRVFIFCNDGDPKYYISSADWMIRNLDNRVEVATPVYDPKLKKQLQRFMEIQFQDSQKARILNEKQDNKQRNGTPGSGHRAQLEIFEHLKQNGSKKLAEHPTSAHANVFYQKS